MKLRLLALAILSFAMQASAQLSGTYTIGGTSPDYANFSTAVAALVSSGVSGPVTFNVRDGVYGEKLILPAITGTSDVNRVVFQSENNDSTLVTLTDASSTSSTNNFTLQLNGADFVTFRKMTISRTGNSTYGTVINVGNGSLNSVFENNILDGSTATTLTTNSCVLYSASGTTSNDSGMVIRTNRIRNGSYGIYLFGPSATVLEAGLEITRNHFENTYGRGLHLGNMNAPMIEDNVISTSTSYATFYSMYFTACNNNMSIQRNSMSSPNGGYGLYFTGSNGAAGLPISIVNNFIHVGGTGTAYGMYFTASSNMNIWHNSVHVSGTGATSRCFYSTGATTTKLVVQNNILANSGGGVTYYIVSSALNSLSISNYNDLYTNGANLAYWNTGNISNITVWRDSTGRDPNSVSADPVFASTTDLHVFGGAVDNAGTPLALVTIDIDGDPRSLSNPDIGADEFSPYANNLALVGLSQPSIASSCGSTDVEFAVLVENFGSAPQSNIPVQIDISGALTVTLYDTIPGPLNPNAMVSHPFVQTVNTSAGGLVNIMAFVSLATDQYRGNDTLNTVRNFYAIPNPPTVVSPQQGCDNNPHILATPEPGDAAFWYDEPSGGNLLHIGDDFSPVLSSDTVFYVESRQGSGSGGCLRIVECEIGGTDYIEIQNLSAAGFDATGWSVVVSNSYTDINLFNANIWSLGYFAAGEIQFRTDGTVNPWGSNILWNPGSKSWAMLLDPAGTVKDFVVWDWTDTEIHTLLTGPIAGFPVSIGAEWSGDGIISCTTGTISRKGGSDNNDAADFACETATQGTQNVNLLPAFANCGLGLCGSTRVPVQVNLVPGVFVSLGNDTALVSPISYTLDAGSGFTAYEWSDGSTGSTLNINAPGTYWVTVTGANGCTFTDYISITIAVGVSQLSYDDRLHVYPNPAKDQLNIELAAGLSASLIRLADINGRIVKEALPENGSNISTVTMDLGNLDSGVYFLQVLNKDAVSVMKILVQH